MGGTVRKGRARKGQNPSGLQSADRRAEMRVRVIPKRRDEGMSLEDRLHDAALNASPAAMNEPQLAQACVVGGAHVLVDDRRDIARRERVEIDLALDRDSDRLRGHDSGVRAREALA